MTTEQQDEMERRIAEWLDHPWHAFGDDFYICACEDGLHMPVQWVTKSAGFGTQGQARDRIIADHEAASREAALIAERDHYEANYRNEDRLRAEAVEREAALREEIRVLRDAMNADPHMPYDVLTRRHKARLEKLDALREDADALARAIGNNCEGCRRGWPMIEGSNNHQGAGSEGWYFHRCTNSGEMRTALTNHAVLSAGQQE